jgi:RNA polymerase sigma factor (sigma-70 family)
MGDAAPQALLAELRRMHADGVQSYGPFALPFERFAERATGRLSARLAGADGDPRALVERCRAVVAADLYLAIACDERIDGAWDVLLSRFVPPLASIARRRGIASGAAEELARDILSDLMVHPGPGATRTRLASFDGAGTLLSWLAVVLLRCIADRRRRGERHVPLNENEDSNAGGPQSASAKTADDGDPVRQAIDGETLTRTAGELRRLWSGLTPLERQGISLRYRDGIQQKSIARMLGVGESRLCRLLQRAVDRIRETVVRGLPRGAHGEVALRESEWNAIRDAMADLLQSPPPTTDPPSEGPTRHEPV